MSNANDPADTDAGSDDSSSPPRWFTAVGLPGPLDSPPPSNPVEVTFGARSHRGSQRFLNDDHYLILRLGRHHEILMTSLPDDSMPQRFEEFGYGMVVADGVGSNAELASRLAITTLVHLTLYFGKWNVRINEPVAEEVMDRAERFWRGVDSTLLQAGRYSQLGLQSTLTAVMIAGSELFVAHVGHTRAYLYRDGKLLRLTRDHTVTGADQGEEVAIAAATAQDQHHTLTDTMGKAGTRGPRVDVERCGLLDGDTILLCTNGLTDAVDDAAIADVLRLHGAPDDQCRALVDLAVASGGEDDVTVLAARYSVSQ